MKPPLLAVGVALYVLGSLIFFFMLQTDDASPYIAIMAGLFTGAGSVPVCVAWGRQLMSMEFREAILFVAIVSAASSVLSWGMIALPTLATYVVFPFALLVGSLMPLVAPLSDTPAAEEVDLSLDQHEEHEPRKLLPSLKKLASVVWLPAAGLLLFAFMMAVRKVRLFDSIDSELIGGIIAGALVMLLYLIKSERPLLSIVYKVVVPIAASVLLVLSSFPSQSVSETVSAVCTYVFLAFLAVFALASLIGIAHAGEFSPAFLFGVALFGGALVSTMGIGLMRVFPDLNVQSVLLPVLTAVFFAVIFISLGFEVLKLQSLDENRHAAASLQDTLDVRCDVLSRRYRLSHRESEILHFMGRGHSPAHIAKMLLISDSTARSHVRNIYRKLNVSSREELLQLIDEDDEAEERLIS
ncbi:MAG: response regulator transcription factor [Coriobacteriia bacterium]